MSKGKNLWIVLDLIFVVVFNALFYMISGFDHSVAVWVAYAFIHIAYLLLVLTPKFVESGSARNATDVPIYLFSSVFFLASFVIDIVLIIIKIKSMKVVVGINIILIAIYLYLLISNMLANGKTNADMKRQTLEAYFVKNAANNLKSIINQADKEYQGKIEKLYDKVSVSQTKSHPEVSELEGEITNLIGQLVYVVENNESDKIDYLLNMISRKVDERNSRLRIIG